MPFPPRIITPCWACSPPPCAPSGPCSTSIPRWKSASSGFSAGSSDLSYSADLLTNEASTVVGLRRRAWPSGRPKSKACIRRWKGCAGNIRNWRSTWNAIGHSRRRGSRARQGAVAEEAAVATRTPPRRAFLQHGLRCGAIRRRHRHALTMIVYKPGEARDLPVMPHGSVTAPATIDPAPFPHGALEGRQHVPSGLGPRSNWPTTSSPTALRWPPASSSIASGAGISAKRWSPRPAISARRAKSPRIRNCSTIWRPASSPTAGRSNG